MTDTRNGWIKHLFFWAPQKESEEKRSEHKSEIDCVERKKTEEKLQTLRKQFDELKDKLQVISMSNLFFVMGEALFEKMDKAFEEIELKNDAYTAFHVFLDNMLESVNAYQSLSESAVAVINIKQQLQMTSVSEAEKTILHAQLATQQTQLNSQYGEFIASSGKQIESSLQLAGNTDWSKVFGGIGLAVVGSLIIGAAALLYVSTASTSLPLSAMVAMIGVDLILSGVGIAIGVTMAIGAASIIGGSILAAKGKQHGLSKEAYEGSRAYPS